MTAALLNTEIVRDVQRFAALAERWDALAARMGTPLARHTWYNVVLGTLRQQLFELSVVLIWDGDILAAAAPLILDKSLSPARLVPIDGFVGEPFRLLYRDPKALEALGHACAGLRRPILFRRLESGETDLALLSSALRSTAAVNCTPRHASVTVELPSNFEAFESSMSTSRRSTIRRKWRGATREHGEILAEFITPEPRDVVEQLARIEAIEGSGWKQRSGTALAADPMMRDLVSRLANAFALEGLLVLAYLKIGGRDAACRLILRQQSAWFEIKIGYDEEFARFSPGVLLMHETLREACRTGIGSYAFLGLREGWQDHWPHQATEDFRIATYPLRPSGAFALADDCRQAVVSLSRRFRR
jgi:CelD/BcsL family acetyltransferase involved in cellulose biosynthesis